MTPRWARPLTTTKIMMTPIDTQGDVGRLKYSSRAKARRIAKRLDLDGVHSHKFEEMNGGRRFYMPGTNHRELSRELQNRGLPPAPPRSQMQDSGMGMGMGGPKSDTSTSTDSVDETMFGDDDTDNMFGGIEQIDDLGSLKDEDAKPLGEMDLTGDEDDDGDMEIY